MCVRSLLPGWNAGSAAVVGGVGLRFPQSSTLPWVGASLPRLALVFAAHLIQDIRGCR